MRCTRSLTPYQATYVTRPRPGKTGLIYTKYMCSYYGMYVQFCVCYAHSVSFIEFLMDFCICDDIFNLIWITDKMLLHFKLSKSGQTLCVDKTCFPGPVTYVSNNNNPYKL